MMLVILPPAETPFDDCPTVFMLSIMVGTVLRLAGLGLAGRGGTSVKSINPGRLRRATGDTLPRRYMYQHLSPTCADAHYGLWATI